MRYFLPTFATVFLSISGCASTLPENAEFERISSKEQYLELVAGRVGRTKGTNITSTAFADGTMKGRSGAKTFTGTWTWEDEYFCREVTVESKVLEPDCQTVEISGSTLKVTRKKGEGEIVYLQLK